MSYDLYYFLSSLSMLKRGEKPRLSHEQFMEACATYLAEKDARDVAALSLAPGDILAASRFNTARQWNEFETLLRNTAAQLRANALKRTDFIPRDTRLVSQYTQKLVSDAFAIANPAERENALDAARWQFLDDMESQASYTLEAVALYALKLLLLERIASRKLEPGMETFNALVENAVRQATENRHEN